MQIGEGLTCMSYVAVISGSIFFIFIFFMKVYATCAMDT